MKKKTRQVKIKARPVAAREQFDSALDDNGIRWQPIWTLPRTPEAWDAMVEQGAKAIALSGKYGRDLSRNTLMTRRSATIAVLTALSLVRPTK